MQFIQTAVSFSQDRCNARCNKQWQAGMKKNIQPNGYQYPKDSVRIEQLDEALHIIKAMWTDVKAAYSGKYYSIKEAICNPKPLQKPHPIIMVGSSGEKLLLRVVAKHADRYNHPFGTPDELKRKVEVLKEHCKSIGRDHKEIEKSVLIRVIVANSDKEVEQIVRKVKNKDETIEQYLDTYER